MRQLRLIQMEQQARRFIDQLNRDTRLIDNMATEMSRTGQRVGRDISSENQAIFVHSYQAESNSINRQLAGLGIVASMRLLSRNNLDAVFTSDFSRFRGDRAAFERMASRILNDRRLGDFYFRRALRRLGATDPVASRLMTEFIQGLVRGEGIPQLQARIRGVTRSKRYQAVRIARTESIKALNQGRYLSYGQAINIGIPIKLRWVATHDPRTRDSHAHIDGETIEYGETFSNGLKYPLDSNGSPEEIIHCRCVSVGVLDIARNSTAYQELKERIENMPFQ